MDNIEWYTLNQKQVENKLSTSINIGLTSAEHEKRLSEYGPNELVEKAKVSVLEIFINQFKSLVVFALLIAAGISFAMEEFLEGLVILAVLFLNACLGTFQEYRAEKSLEALKKMTATSSRVLRDGRQEKVYARDLVPGDIIFLEVGDRVPADARLVRAINLAIDESMLTGESVPVSKNVSKLPSKTPISERKNMVYKDTIVTSGRGTGIVVATGMNTEIGKLATMLQEVPQSETPLQKRLTGFMKLLGKVTIIGVIIVILLGLYVANFSLEEVARVAVSQAVSFIPEGLPVAVTVVLAVGVGAMAAKNAIVRKLPAVETLGCVTVICTDKTGTLTRNEMTVTRLYYSGKEVEVKGTGYSIVGEFYIENSKIAPFNDSDLLTLLRTATLCNNATIETDGNEAKIFGDPTEGSLLIAAAKAKISKKELETSYPRVSEIQFDSEKKFMATFNGKKDALVQHVKGAPEKVLSFCTHILINGKEIPLTEKLKSEVLSANNKMASQALRVLAFAFKIKATESTSDPSGMTFIGLAGMIDPPREEVKEALKLCKEAGIRVVMITGDHKMTALGIAKQLNLAQHDSEVITGEELDKLSENEFMKKLDNLSIYARTTAEHKMRIVSALKTKKQVVAMTGDGINDVLAIKKADVGIAMGISGTEVTKESSDMVLTDDNFSSIVSAVEEGRGAYLNIKKVVSYLLATNFGEVIFLFMILLSGLFLPETLPLVLLPVQILWINLATDGCCVVPLSFEPKDRDVMKQKPRKIDEPLITKDMAVFIGITSVVMALGAMFVFLVEYNSGTLDHARTMVFTTMVLFQLFSATNVRTKMSVFKNSPFSNIYLIGGFILSFILLTGAIYIPFMNDAMHTTPLTIRDWIFAFAVASTLLVVFEIKKFFNRLSENKQK